MLRRLSACLAAAAAAALATPGLASATSAPSAAGPVPCSSASALLIGPLAFTPPEIPPGLSSTAALPVANCTGATQTATETWYGTWLSAASTGIPDGCPAIDPLLRQVSVAPYQTVTTATGYLVPAGCTADALRLTVRISRSGTLLAQRTADLVIDRPTAG